MRVRRLLAGAGLSALVAVGISLPAHAAAWQAYATYTSKFQCVDAGQQLVRENFNAYKCTLSGSGYVLWVQ